MRGVRLVIGAVVSLFLIGVVELQAQELDQRIIALIEEVSPERLMATVEKLASFETRNTLSTTTDPTRGIGAAREWIFQEFESYSPRLQVEFDTHQVAAGGWVGNAIELRHVVAILPGQRERRLHVGGSHDS